MKKNIIYIVLLCFVSCSNREELITMARLEKKEDLMKFEKDKQYFYDEWNKHYSNEWKNVTDFKKMDLHFGRDPNNHMLCLQNIYGPRINLINAFVTLDNIPKIIHHKYDDILYPVSESNMLIAPDNKSDKICASISLFKDMENNSYRYTEQKPLSVAYYRIIAFSLDGGVISEPDPPSFGGFYFGDKWYRLRYNDKGGIITVLNGQLRIEFSD